MCVIGPAPSTIHHLIVYEISDAPTHHDNHYYSWLPSLYCDSVKPSNILLNYDKSIGSALKKTISKNKSSQTHGNFPIWNPKHQDNLVLADFGLSGDLTTCSKNAGTPGFGSPEQMIGKVHQKSDLYALGKLAILILFDWNVAWSLIASPKTKSELKAEKIHGTKLQKIIADLLQVKNTFVCD